MHRTVLTTAIILFACLTLWTCNKDDETFCALVNEENFDATGPLIDDFLATLKNGNQADHLAKLKEWLECKSCVEKAQILCNSCILTFPPQSELSVDFVSNGIIITMTLDILMSEPLKFRAYH